MRSARALTILVAISALAACEAIVDRPLSTAPLNDCATHSCDTYETSSASVSPTCRDGRCEIQSAGGLPDYPFWIVANLPDMSIFAPGLTYVFYSDERGEPAFKVPASPNPLCSPALPSRCLQIGGDAEISGGYTATVAAIGTVVATLDPASAAPIAGATTDRPIPVSVVFDPVGNTNQPRFPALPLQALVAASSGARPSLEYSRDLLAGTYTRDLYPQPPFDAIFPPTSEQISFVSGTFTSSLVLGVPPTSSTQQPLDFSTNVCSTAGGIQDGRCALVTRDDGLDGWRVWIESASTKKRISVLHTFANGPDGATITKGAALLYTAGKGTSLGDGYNAVVAPPPSWTAVPRLETPLFGGAQGLQALVVPSFPAPVTVRGVVAEPGDGATLLGYAAKVSFVSSSLATKTIASPLLHYETTVSTDDRGQFATVLPPGNYIATIEPALGTGFAKATASVAIDRTITALTLRPPPRPLVRGHAVLTDGRDLAEATVIAEPRTSADGSMPRAGHTVTGADGSFAIELDPGPYVLSVIPKAGTGFPRVVTGVNVEGSTTVPDIRVPPPTRLSFTLRDPNATANPIVRAIVRIFASRPNDSIPVEIGQAMSDTSGAVEILLAQTPQ